MYKWSNIEVENNDSEIAKINSIEDSFESLAIEIIQIRELITRLEICHFKYKTHIKYIKEAILELKADIIPENIGRCHIRNGETICKTENSGRSLLGQQYVWALKKWLDPLFLTQNIKYNVEFNQSVFDLIGEKNQTKERYVKLLISRLTWDWKTMKSLSNENSINELDQQIARVDICHYHFPNNIKTVLKGIGNNTAIKDFEGCGSFNEEIRTNVAEEFISTCQLLKSFVDNKDSKINNQYRIWLAASLLKTLKEHIKLDVKIESLVEIKEE